MLSWEELEKTCQSCSRCGLCEGRTNLVFGVGCRTADVMFIGEGPGEQEDLQGIPFVGPAGKLLDDMMSIIDLDRTNSYIANIVKCRPPHNRDPKEEEQDACIEYLRNQVALVKPKIIVCLGRISASWQCTFGPASVWGFRQTSSNGFSWGSSKFLLMFTFSKDLLKETLLFFC